MKLIDNVIFKQWFYSLVFSNRVCTPLSEQCYRAKRFIFMLILLTLIFSIAHGSALIEQPEGWTITPVHAGSSVLKIKNDHRPIIAVPSPSKTQYKEGDVWLLCKEEGDSLCALKDGVLCQYNLSQEQGWRHDKSVLESLRSFAQECGDYDSFLFYLSWNECAEDRDGILYGCEAAVRDLEHDPVEPLEGGWNLVLPRKHLQDSHCDDITCKKFGKHNYPRVWLRRCGRQKYIYGAFGDAIVVYNISHSTPHPDDESGAVYIEYLNRYFERKALPKDPHNYSGLCTKFYTRFDGAFYGHGGCKDHGVLKRMLGHKPQKNGWNLTLVLPRQEGFRAWPETIETLKLRYQDLFIKGSLGKEDIFSEGSVWLRVDENGGLKLCFLKKTVLFEHDLEDKAKWTHLPETLEFLQGFAQSGEGSFRAYLEYNMHNINAMHNACMASVRDALFTPIETKIGWSLTADRDGIFDYMYGDISINGSGFEIEYPEWAVWVRFCGHSVYLLARVQNHLCQYNLSSDDEFWGSSDVILKTLRMFLRNKGIMPHDTKRECITVLKNGTVLAICNALYKETTMCHKACAWTFSRPHPILFNVSHEDQLLCGSYKTSTVVRGKSAYTENSMWWRYDGRSHLCFAAGDGCLLEYDLKHTCDSCTPVKLKDLRLNNQRLLSRIAGLAEKNFLAYRMFVELSDLDCRTLQSVMFYAAKAFNGEAKQ